MNMREVFSERILQLRKRRGLTQQQAADELEISRVSLGFYETGQRLPDAEMLAKIAYYYDVSADYLLGRTEIKTADIDLKAICEYTGLTQENVECLHSKTTTDSYYPDIIYHRKALQAVINFVLQTLCGGFGDELAKLGIGITKREAFDKAALKLFCKRENIPFDDEEYKEDGKNFLVSYEQEGEFVLRNEKRLTQFKNFSRDLKHSLPYMEEVDFLSDTDYSKYLVMKDFSQFLEDITDELLLKNSDFYDELYSQLLGTPDIDGRIEIITRFYKGRFPDEVYLERFERAKRLCGAVQKEEEKIGKHNTP